jgi:hypothetical protein
MTRTKIMQKKKTLYGFETRTLHSKILEATTINSLIHI